MPPGTVDDTQQQQHQQHHLQEHHHHQQQQPPQPLFHGEEHPVLVPLGLVDDDDVVDGTVGTAGTVFPDDDILFIVES